MKAPNSQTTRAVPEATGYLKGAPPESRQFDFLIGDWDVAGSRYGEDGSMLLQYQASWTARHLNEGRMVMDEFKVYAPGGSEASSFLTLRTYSAASRRWKWRVWRRCSRLRMPNGMANGKMARCS